MDKKQDLLWTIAGLIIGVLFFAWSHGVIAAPQIYSTIVNYAAQQTQLSPRLIRAVIDHESAGNYRAVSNANAIGLMQLVPNTGGRAARHIFADESGAPSKKFLTNPWNNIVYGSVYLKHLEGIFPSFPPKVRLALALAAYNWGVTNVSYQLRLSSYPPLHYWEFKPWAQGHLPLVTQRYVFGIMQQVYPNDDK